MKKIFAFVLFTLCMAELRGQSPVFAPKGAEWVYEFKDGYYSSGLFFETKGICRITYEKDTLAYTVSSQGSIPGGIKTYRLFRTRMSYFDSGSSTGDLIISTGIELVRQSNDTVFVRHGVPSIPFSLGSENIYFIFNISKGDTIQFRPAVSIGFADLRIDSIAAEKVNNFNLKTWFGRSYVKLVADGYGYEYLPLKFMERFGPINDFWIYFALGGYKGGWHQVSPKVKLRCYSDPEFGKINFTGIPCDQIVGTKEADLDVLRYCYFDNNQLYYAFEKPTPLSRLDLFDLSGRLMQSIPIIEDFGVLSFEKTLPTGIYLTFFWGKGGKRFVHKVFKTN